jgi:putative tryptophan/tyrosine transport system substrate-binding protein
MRRRDFLAIVCASSAGWPFAALGQRKDAAVIGFLGLQTADPRALAKFREGLAQWGYVEGQNLAIEYQWASDNQQIPSLAAKLVEHHVSLIVASGGMAFARAAKEATSTIPVLFSGVGLDPVENGVAASFNHPGGNATGISVASAALVPKRLELLKQVVPVTGEITYLQNDDVSGLGPSAKSEFDAETELAKELGLAIEYARSEGDLETAFANMARRRTRAFLLASDPLFGHARAMIVSLAARYGLPGGYPRREFADAGGLMSYGPSIAETWRQIGEYAGRILRGARPQELPIQLQNKYELVINVKAAKSLGLTVPPLLHALADDVIE